MLDGSMGWSIQMVRQTQSFKSKILKKGHQWLASEFC